jgi:hypothetical protein
MTYGAVEVALRRRNDRLNSLPTLCICLKNSLSDIFYHSLFNFALIRCSSCINSGSLRRTLNLLRRRDFYYRNKQRSFLLRVIYN